MSTATLSRTQEKSGTWSTIFPTEQVTEQQSALFVKKLLAVAVSNITYLRAIFPEYAFGDRCLEDLSLKILRDDSSCPGACQVIRWVKGCFDALDKKYLKMLIVGIYTNPDDPETVIESYTFKFSYTENGVVDIYRNSKKISSVHTAAETKKATIRLLRTIIVLTQSLQPLPDDVMMTMKLLYYDDITPPDYEPPGFKSSESDNFKFDEDPMNIKVGDVNTPFHTVKLRIKTDAKQFEVQEEEPLKDNTDLPENSEVEHEISSEALDVEEDVQMETETVTKKDEYEFSEEQPHAVPEVSSKCNKKTKSRTEGGRIQMVPEPTLGDDAPGGTPSKPGLDDQAISTTGSQNSNATATQDEMGVRCPCGCNEDDGLMILCAICSYWQHGVCFMVLKEEDAPSTHICDRCCNPDNPDLKPTDPHLIGVSEVAAQATCLWRKALLACTETNRILAPNFARRLGVEMTVAQGLINRLEKEGYIKNPGKGKRLGKVVDRQKLTNEGLKKYFKTNKQDLKGKEKGQTQNEEDTEMVVEQEPKKTRGNKGRKTVDIEIEELTEQAEEMSLTGQRKKTEESSNKKNPSKSRLRGKSKMPKDGVSKESRGRKRVKAIADEDHDFELSNSQDVFQDEGGRRKKHKASIAQKAILV